MFAQGLLARRLITRLMGPPLTQAGQVCPREKWPWPLIHTGQGPTPLASGLGRTPKSHPFPHGHLAQRFWELLPDGCGLCWGGSGSLDLPIEHTYDTCIHTRTYTCTHTYAHTHTHTHTHPAARSSTLPPLCRPSLPRVQSCQLRHLPAPMLPICSDSSQSWGSPCTSWKGEGHQLSRVVATSGGGCSSEMEVLGAGLRSLSQLCDHGQVPPISEPVSTSGQCRSCVSTQEARPATSHIGCQALLLCLIGSLSLRHQPITQPVTFRTHTPGTV